MCSSLERTQLLHLLKSSWIPSHASSPTIKLLWYTLSSDCGLDTSPSTIPHQEHIYWSRDLCFRHQCLLFHDQRSSPGRLFRRPSPRRSSPTTTYAERRCWETGNRSPIESRESPNQKPSDVLGRIDKGWYGTRHHRGNTNLSLSTIYEEWYEEGLPRVYHRWKAIEQVTVRRCNGMERILESYPSRGA